MITLAFDSSAKVASVAVMRDDEVIADYTVNNGFTQSELLLPMAEDMLKSLRLSFSDVNLLACSVGPGSFTGVRIGTAIVKGLAFGRNVPTVNVSALEALAYNLAYTEGIIAPVMDARRGQVYTAIFACDGGEPKRLTEDMAIGISELAGLLAEHSGKRIYLVGDGYDVALTGLKKAGLSLCGVPKNVRLQSAASVARVARRDFALGKALSDTEIKPTYLRMPQAERERLEREGSGGGK